MGIRIPSGEELAKSGQGAAVILPEDEYLAEVVEITVNPDQPNPYKKDDKGNPVRRDTLTVRLKPISFASGDDLVDEHGDEVPQDKLLFAFIDPTVIGLRLQPSKARKFFASCLAQPIEDGIVLSSWDELVGKRLIASVEIKEAQGDKPRTNRVRDFRQVRRRPAKKAEPTKTDEEVKAGASELLSKAAKEIFEDDDTF